MSNKRYNEVSPGLGKLSSAEVEQGWPDSLENFVDKCLSRSKLLSAKDKLALQRQLQLLITMAQTEGKLYSNAWERQQIPILDNNCPLELCGSTNTVVDPKQTPKKRKGNKYDSDEKKKQRLERFNHESSPSPGPNLPNKPVFKKDNATPTAFVGRCTTLEKRYLRLTSEPDPNLVRPQMILERAVKRLMSLVDEKPYSYIKDQFKAIRQDLTVQHIKNDFSMYVYELNAKLSIENNDLGEMNQCVSQLEHFYDSIGSKTVHFKQSELEFMCYRILYMLMVENHSEIFKIKYKLSKRTYVKSEHLHLLNFIKLAFQLQDLVLTNNYYKYFKLVGQFKPLKLAYHLIENFLTEKPRIKTMNTLVKSYKKFNIELLIDLFTVDEDEVMRFLYHFKFDEYLTNREFDCTILRPHIYSLMAKTNFKKIDIKGQV